MTVTLAERKLHTIALLARLEDEDVLLLIEQLLTDALSDDWGDELSEPEKESIRRGIAQLNQGEGETLESFQQRVKSKFP